MRRLLRLLLVCLLACALPLQAAVASVMQAELAPAHAATMAGGAPCPHHAPAHHAGTPDKAGCGACCGPLVAQQALLAVAPVAPRWAPAPHAAADAAAPQFLTGGTDRPPRPRLA